MMRLVNKQEQKDSWQRSSYNKKGRLKNEQESPDRAQENLENIGKGWAMSRKRKEPGLPATLSRSGYYNIICRRGLTMSKESLN